jgi:hypothetical protein
MKYQSQRNTFSSTKIDFFSFFFFFLSFTELSEPVVLGWTISFDRLCTGQRHEILLDHLAVEIGTRVFPKDTCGQELLRVSPLWHSHLEKANLLHDEVKLQAEQTFFFLKHRFDQRSAEVQLVGDLVLGGVFEEGNNVQDLGTCCHLIDANNACDAPDWNRSLFTPQRD